LGFPDQQGASGYFLGSSTLTQSEIEHVQNFLLAKGHMLQNTRLEKDVRDGGNHYTVRVASIAKDPPDGQETSYLLPNQGGRIEFVYGDHSDVLEAMVDHLTQAMEYVRNEEQKAYLQATVEHLSSGSMQAHKDASTAWLKDEHPSIETLIGFIESYRDPTAVRCEFEALVAVQNLELTRQLMALAACGESAIQRLPWCQPPYLSPESVSPFENERFIKPDFVSLDGDDLLVNGR